MWTWTTSHLQGIWESVLGISVVVGTFLVSKKAILAGLYYLLNLLKIGHRSVQKISEKTGGRKISSRRRKEKDFWSTQSQFQQALSKGKSSQEDEYRHWVTYLIAEGSVNPEDLDATLLYRYFLRYSLLGTLAEKKHLVQELKAELSVRGQNSSSETSQSDLNDSKSTPS